MNTPGQDNVHFYGSQWEIPASQPYAILSTRYVSFMVNRFDTWTKMMVIHPGLSAMCVEAKSIHIDIATAWSNAIEGSIQDGLFPTVILPIKDYEEAMLLLKITCQMEADLHAIIEQESQFLEDLVVHKSPLPIAAFA